MSWIQQKLLNSLLLFIFFHGRSANQRTIKGNRVGFYTNITDLYGLAIMFVLCISFDSIFFQRIFFLLYKLVGRNCHLKLQLEMFSQKENHFWAHHFQFICACEIWKHTRVLEL